VLRGVDTGQLSMEVDGSLVTLTLGDVERARLIPEL
jgi:hypothetical protein